MTIIITAIVIIAIIGIAIMIYNNNIRKEKSDNSMPDTPEQKQENSSDREIKTIMNSLLSLNILLRKDKDVSEKMIETIESVIDDLIMIIPGMMERYPGETLTYEIKKIGKNHLYKIIKEYLDLSLESRENQFAIFEKTIKNLHEISSRSRNIVEKNETAEFKTMANFLAGKFS